MKKEKKTKRKENPLLMALFGDGVVGRLFVSPSRLE